MRCLLPALLLLVLAAPAAPAGAEPILTSDGDRGLFAFQPRDRGLEAPILAADATPDGPGGLSVAVAGARRPGLVTQAVGPGGHAVILWSEARQRGVEPVLLASYRPAGGSFGGAEVLVERWGGFPFAVDVGADGLALVALEVPSGPPAVFERAPGGGFTAVPVPAELRGRPVDVGVGDEVADELAMLSVEGRTIGVSERAAGGGFGAPRHVFEVPRGTTVVASAPDALRAVLLGRDVPYGLDELRVVERVPGAGYGPLRRVSGAERADQDLRMAVGDGGGLAVVWRDASGRVRAVVREPGGELLPSVNLAGLGTFGPLDAAVSRGGDVVVAARSSAGLAAAYRPAGGAFRTFTLATFPRGGEPSGIVFGDGRALVAWSESVGEHLLVVTRALSATGPGQRRVLSRRLAYTPARGRVCSARGRPVVLRTPDLVLRRDREEQFGVCHRRSGNAWFLGGMGAFTATGPLLAYAYNKVPEGSEPEPITTRIELLDVRDVTRQVRRFALPRPTADRGAGIGDIAVSSRGAVAYTACFEDETPDPPSRCAGARRLIRVYAVPSASSRRRLLDRGRGIDARSLRLRGSELTWTRDGVRRSARLR